MYVLDYYVLKKLCLKKELYEEQMLLKFYCSADEGVL